jgi:hypothetical protein
VIGDTLDRLGRRHQFLPPEIQPLRDDMVVVGRAMPVLEAADEIGEAQARPDEVSNPFGLMRAVGSSCLRPSSVEPAVVCTNDSCGALVLVNESLRRSRRLTAIRFLNPTAYRSRPASSTAPTRTTFSAQASVPPIVGNGHDG